MCNQIAGESLQLVGQLLPAGLEPPGVVEEYSVV